MERRPRTSSATTLVDDKRHHWSRRLVGMVAVAAAALVVLEAVMAVQPRPREPRPVVPTPTSTPKVVMSAGTLLAQSATTTFTPEQVEATSHEDYGSFTPKPVYGVARTLVQYRSYETDGTPITVYARVYQPVGKTGAPIFGFAPGTTGIGDECAPSLEDPAKANWANYESHMETYASQGYATVITDYEGMRDPNQIHHYMVGEVEGRAVLDSVRALINLDRGTEALDTSHVLLGGYSQGGHGAFWADQIAASYAPELKVAGVVGFGPVMDVEETLADVAHGANIDWFGPYVLVSYADYYHDDYDLPGILQPRYLSNLRSDVLAHCIDTDAAFWGSKPSLVYTPEFLNSLATGLNDPAYAPLKARLEANVVGNAKTASAKLINSGTRDNVVLPAQQVAAMARICPNSRGPAQLKMRPGASHYTTMEVSLADTLTWMHDLAVGTPVASTCP